MLGELLKDIQQLEVEEVLAQIDLPLPLTSTDLSDPFLSKDLQDPADLSAADVASGKPSAFTAHSPPWFRLCHNYTLTPARAPRLH